jgi:hypothetical protein
MNVRPSIPQFPRYQLHEVRFAHQCCRSSAQTTSTTAS